MDVRLHDSPDEFCAIAEPPYGCDPVAHTIELTLLRGGGFPDDALLLSVWDGDSPIGAALQTPPYPLACNGIPSEAYRSVAKELARRHPPLSGVRGERETAMAFADVWRSLTGRAGTVTTEERLYRLGRLHPPAGVPGGHRNVTSAADRAYLVDWVELFFVETFSHHRDDSAGERFIDKANAVGDRFVLWEDNGTPVSMAMLRATRGRDVAYRAGLHPAACPQARLRLSRHRRGSASGEAWRRRRRGAVRRPGQPDIQRQLSTHRLRSRWRFGAGRVRSRRLTDRLGAERAVQRGRVP